MKKFMMVITTLALCFVVMGDLTFASETERPVLKDDHANTEEGLLRGPITAESEVYRSGTIRVGADKVTITCIFNITYNSATGEVYSVNLSHCSGNPGYILKGTIVKRNWISANTVDVTVDVMVHTGGIYRGTYDLILRI